MAAKTLAPKELHWGGIAGFRARLSGAYNEESKTGGCKEEQSFQEYLGFLNNIARG
jgi:hypothetical protein